MKILRILVSLFMLITILPSCKKEADNINNNDNNTNTEIVLQLASVQFDYNSDTQKETFLYSSTGLINKINCEKWPAKEDSTKSQPYYSIDVQWSPDNSLLKVVHKMAASQNYNTLNFTKDPTHQLVRKGLYPITIAFGSESWLGFDNKGRVIADSNYAGGNVPVSSYKVFTWDANDNIIKIENFLANGSGVYTNNYTTECSYDQNKNPLYSYTPYFFALVVGEYYQYQSKHNLVQEKISFNGSTSVVNSFTYEYNQQGYPTKRIYTGAMPSSTPYIVKYSYK